MVSFYLCIGMWVKLVSSKFYADKYKEEMFATWLNNHFYIIMIGKYKSVTKNLYAAPQK